MRLLDWLGAHPYTLLALLQGVALGYQMALVRRTRRNWRASERSTIAAELELERVGAFLAHLMAHHTDLHDTHTHPDEDAPLH